jgi:hypothetical protein
VNEIKQTKRPPSEHWGGFFFDHTGRMSSSADFVVGARSFHFDGEYAYEEPFWSGVPRVRLCYEVLIDVVKKIKAITDTQFSSTPTSP